VADLMPTAVWTATRSGEVTYFNRRWHEMFSSSDWRALIHPDDRQATFEAWQYAVMTGRPYINLARYRDVTGTYHGLISQAHTVLDSQGRIAYWVGNSIKSAEWPAEVLQVA
jgi:PAS domain-containing protein